MDLLSSFMNKNLEDFVNSYANVVLPDNVSIDALSEIEHERDDKESPLIEHKEYSPDLFSANSFIEHSVIESVMSNIPHPTSSKIDGDKMRGEYGQNNFKLTMDLLPSVEIEDDEKEENGQKDIEHIEQIINAAENAMNEMESECLWEQLPNIPKKK